jgi:hypothetical protein
MADLTWVQGGEARLVALADDRVNLVSTISSAPGSRIEARLASGCSVRVKIHRCKRDGEAFAIEGRLIDATRDVRAELLRLLGTDTTP